MKGLGSIFISCLLVLWSCGTKSVNSSYSQSKLKDYKKYAWSKPDVNTQNPEYRGDLVNSEIKNALSNELSAKGFEEDTINPDFLVKYHTSTENSYYRYNGRRSGVWPGYYDMDYVKDPSNSSYTEGILAIDFIDSKSHKVIWSDSIEGTLDNGKNLTEKIDKGVYYILKNLPDKNGYVSR